MNSGRLTQKSSEGLKGDNGGSKHWFRTGVVREKIDQTEVGAYELRGM